MYFESISEFTDYVREHSLETWTPEEWRGFNLCRRILSELERQHGDIATAAIWTHAEEGIRECAGE